MTTTRSRDDHFTKVPDWLVESDLSLHDYVVLLVLMKHGRTSGHATPGFATISRQARISRDAVMRALRSLEERGLVEIERRRAGTKNLPNLYTLHVERTRVVAPSDHPAGSGSQRVVADSDQVVAGSDQGWSLGATLTRPINESHERDRVHRDATHDDAGDVEDGSAVEIGDSASAGSTRRISDKQSSLLRDWHILAGYGVPTDDTERWMRDLTDQQFDYVKQAWMRERDSRGRGTAYDGPESGDPEYEHLSDRGKQWADVGCLPAEMSA